MPSTKYIDIGLLVESKLQNRIDDDSAALAKHLAKLGEDFLADKEYVASVIVNDVGGRGGIDGYEILSGHLRVRAAKMVGHDGKLKCEVHKDLPIKKRLEIINKANTPGLELRWICSAVCAYEYKNDMAFENDEIMQIMNVKESSLKHLLAIGSMEKRYIDFFLDNEKVPLAVARLIPPLSNEEKDVVLPQLKKLKSVSVKSFQEIKERLLGRKTGRPLSVEDSQVAAEVEGQRIFIEENTGFPVEIEYNAKKKNGKITFNFSNPDEFNDIVFSITQKNKEDI